VKAETTMLLRSVDTRQATGVVRVIQRGARLRGFVVVWGLEPGSRHANHIHGNAPGAAAARCNPAGRRTMRHLDDRPDLIADERGVAFGVINERVTERAVRRGVYLMVHQNPSPPAGMTAMREAIRPWPARTCAEPAASAAGPGVAAAPYPADVRRRATRGRSHRRGGQSSDT
jgi:hypothetical protein